jgi:predicted small secreted protein
MILIGIVLKAQETFFPTKEGTVLIYKTFDKKDKVTNTVKYTIKQVNISGSYMDITYLCESIDPKDKLVFKEEITIHKKGDKLYFDMSNFINKAAFQQNGEIPAEIQITGNNMEVPSNPAPGDVLPDANVEMAMKVGFINMKMSAEVSNRKVEAIEDITVKAGTFKGYKFSSEVNSSAMGMKIKSENIDWYAKGVGIVKTENYDKNGKLQSYMELIEIN